MRSTSLDTRASAYGTRAGLLFGFLLIVDAGLLAVAIARREERLHAAAGATTLLVAGMWLGISYTPSAWLVLLLCLAALGAYQLTEALRAAERLGERGLASSVVYILEPGRFRARPLGAP